MKLEEIRPELRLTGIVPDAAIAVLGAQFHGPDALELTYKDSNGELGQVVLYRENEDKISIHQGEGRPFDADPSDFRIAAESQRILLAGLHDPMLAVATSDVQPLPHQIRAVYGEMLPRTPLRFLLADDPGAGKTIMAGLFIKELILRDDVRSCLVVAPGGLVEQWQDELALKFDLKFEILTSGAENTTFGNNPFEKNPFLIARMDQLARNETLLKYLSEAEFDLVVVDEAHRMSAFWYSGELKASKRFQLGEILGDRARHLLLMTATPHNGKDEDFQTFLSLLDQDRFAGPGGKHLRTITTEGVMRRMIKEKLVTFEGRPLFPERIAETATYRLSDAEQYLYDEVTEYVRNGMNRAQNLDGKRKNTVGFALTVLQRRLASSPEAIYQSLRRRADRLDRLRVDLKDGILDEPPANAPIEFLEDIPDLDELDADEVETAESELVDAATAARTVAELEIEISELRGLAEIAKKLLNSQEDVKWRELREVIRSHVLEKSDGSPRKLIVFTEHRDTLHYLVNRIKTLLDNPDAVVSIHGGIPRNERRRITAEFSSNPDVQILVATDAAGEGLNLQAAHLMVNYDLPWNPNRIEQRFGRIHRIGQQEVCRLWNLVAEDTREGEVFIRLLGKIEEQRNAYDGEIFNVLGTSLGSLNLTQVIKRAIQYGDDPEVKAKMWEVIDEGVSAGLQELLDDEALASEALAPTDLAELRRQMEEAKARRLQPFYIQEAFLEAFRRLNGEIVKREKGRYEITYVPSSVRQRAGLAPIARKYERVTFDIANIEPKGEKRAELLAPGNPLHDTVFGLMVEMYGPKLDRGAVLTSETVSEPTLLVGVVNEVRDATGNTVSKRFGYSFIGESGDPREAGPAPYLDFSAASHQQSNSVSKLSWLNQREQDSVSWIISHQLPIFAEAVSKLRKAELERVKSQVEKRLQKEITRLEIEALKIDEKVKNGKKVRFSAENLRRTADDLQQRKVNRLETLTKQLSMNPVTPIIKAVAVVLPPEKTSSETEPHLFAMNRKEVERRGVDAVLAIEEQLGRNPKEQAQNNPGFDVLAQDENGSTIWIEVKARIEGADTFTITKNEVLQALNVSTQHRLALVRVSEDGAENDEVRYISDAFSGFEAKSFDDFNVVSQNLDWDEWWQRGIQPH